MTGIELVPTVMVAVGAAAAIAALAGAIVHWRAGKSRLLVAVEVIVVVGGIVLAVTPVLGDDVAPGTDLSIIEPAGGTNLVPNCVHVQVKGDVPKGKELVIAKHEDRDDRTYFEKDVRSTDKPKIQEAIITLGDDPTSTAGRKFTIYAYLIDDELTKYIASTNSGDNGQTVTWWSSPFSTLPPGTKVADQVDVARSQSVDPSCGT